MFGDFCMSSFFVPYGQWVICHALKAYLESIVFPIPNTNKAIPGKNMGICDVIAGNCNEQQNILSIEILFKGDWYPHDLERELIENHLNELLHDWNKITDFAHNGIEYIGNDKLMTELGNFLRMGGYIIAK